MKRSNARKLFKPDTRSNWIAYKPGHLQLLKVKLVVPIFFFAVPPLAVHGPRYQSNEMKSVAIGKETRVYILTIQFKCNCQWMPTLICFQRIKVGLLILQRCYACTYNQYVCWIAISNYWEINANFCHWKRFWFTIAVLKMGCQHSHTFSALKEKTEWGLLPSEWENVPSCIHISSINYTLNKNCKFLLLGSFSSLDAKHRPK